MVAAICNFDRTWKSCKKKYKIIFIDYKIDKKAKEILGMDKHQECEWFDQLDAWIFTRACVKNHILASAMEAEDENHEDKRSSKLQVIEIILKFLKKIPRHVRKDLKEDCVQFF